MTVVTSYDELADLWLVDLADDVDLSDAQELRRVLEKTIGSNIAIRCNDMKYIDSTGLGVLVSVLGKSRNVGKTVQITGLRPHIYRIFKLTDLDKLFDIEVA